MATVKFSVVRGVYSDNKSEIRSSFPVNIQPYADEMGSNGVNDSYMKVTDGIVEIAETPGVDRGGINWNGLCYKVFGTKFCLLAENGTIYEYGDVGGDPNTFVSMDYSYDLLAIASGGSLFYFDGSTLKKMTDPAIGVVLYVQWIDGYFMTTDGESIVVTAINDPFAVNLYPYGSSVIDPDPVVCLLRLRNEINAINRYTIEIFDNVGGLGFPFQRVEGAQIQKGAVGSFAACVFMEKIAFVGSGRNEQVGVYLGANATAEKISTASIDMLLSEFSEATLSLVKVESRNESGRFLLYIHLDDKALVYDATASMYLKQPVWFICSSSLDLFEKYRARNFVWCYNSWICGDPTSNKVGRLSKDVASHWGDPIYWEFSTNMIYNSTKGAVFQKLELVSLTGNVEVGEDPTISTSYSLDGVVWSQPSVISALKVGDRNKRLCWFAQGIMRRFRIQRFRGTSAATISPISLECEVEGLFY